MTDDQNEASEYQLLRDGLSTLLTQLVVQDVLRLTEKEVVIKFTNGTRLFVNSTTKIEISVT